MQTDEITEVYAVNIVFSIEEEWIQNKELSKKEQILFSVSNPHCHYNHMILSPMCRSFLLIYHFTSAVNEIRTCDQ